MVVPEISPVDLQVATVRVRNWGEELPVCGAGARLSLPWAGSGCSHPCSCHALSLQATDADSGPRGAIAFSIVSVVLVEDNGVSRPFENLFKVVTAPEQDSYVGSIQ